MTQVREISAQDLKARVDSGQKLVLIDVRERWEWQMMGRIDGAVLIPLDTLPEHIDGFGKDAAIVIYCAHGSRSYHAAQYMVHHGFSDVVSLAGGIESWKRVSR